MGRIKSTIGLVQSVILHSLLFLSLQMACRPALSQNNTDQDSIKFYTTQLLNGIATGDTSAWSIYLGDSAILTSEDGSVKSKQQFIHGIGIPPAYLKVKETISNPLFRINSGTIVFIYTANLTLNVYGQERVNEICQTDTWFKTAGGWKLISSESLDKLETPIVQKMNPQVLALLTGEYKLSDVYDYKIFVRDGKLFIQLQGKKEIELLCESDYTYFASNRLQTRYIFAHDNNNKITGLILRRAGRDIQLPKTK